MEQPLEGMDFLMCIPSLVALCKKLDDFEEIERKEQVCKQSQMLQDAERVSASPELVNQGFSEADVVMVRHADEKVQSLKHGDGNEATDKNKLMWTFEKRQQGKSQECIFWKAWVHIARWREEEVDALKEGTAKRFLVRQSRSVMINVLCHWRRVAIMQLYANHNGSFYCTWCQIWMNGPLQYGDHVIGKKHRKNTRRAHYQQLNSWLPQLASVPIHTV